MDENDDLVREKSVLFCFFPQNVTVEQKVSSNQIELGNLKYAQKSFLRLGHDYASKVFNISVNFGKSWG